MSLDVYLEMDNKPIERLGTGIYIREDGQTKEITIDEWYERFPDRDPIVIDYTEYGSEIYWSNITHNLGNMANEAGIYKHLWRPDEIGIEKAKQLIEPLTNGLALLQSEPERFKEFNPSNGWGDYYGLVQFVANYLGACRKFPEAIVRVSR